MAADNNELYQERAQILRSIKKLNEEIAEFSSQENRDVREYNKLMKKRSELAQGLKDTNLIILENQQEAYSNAFDSLSSMSQIYVKLTKLEKQRIMQMSQTTELSDLAVERGNRLSEISQELAQLSSDDIIKRQILANEFDTLIDKFATQKRVSDEMVDNLKAQFSVAQDLSNLSTRQKEILEKQLETYDFIKESIGGVLDTAALLTENVSGAIGAISIGLGFIANKAGEIRQQLGGITSLSTTFMSYFSDDAVDTFQEISIQFGSIEEASIGTQLNTALLGKNLGIGGKEAATLLGSFARIEGGSKEIAEDMIITTRELARQGGVIPSQVMSDLAQNTEAFALYAKDGGRNLAEAGVFAAQLGTDMGTLTGITDNLLDFEQSITQELELSALLGRQINLDAARRLAYEGDIEGAVSSTLNQLGGIEEFNRMDIFQKRQTAELLGISVAELQRMSENQTRVATMGDEINARFSRLNELGNTFLNEYLGTSLQGLGGMLITIGQMGHGMQALNKFAIIQKIQEKASATWTAFKLKLKGKELATETAITTQKKTQTALQSRMGKTPGGGLMGGITGKGMIQGAAALLIVAGAVWTLGKAFQEMAAVEWDDIPWGTLVLSLGGLIAITAGLGTISPLILAGSAALLSMGAAIFVVGKGLASIAGGMGALGSVTDKIGELVSYSGGILKVSGALTSLAASLGLLGAASLVSLPALMSVTLVSSAVSGVSDMIGGGESISGGNEALISEIRGLRQDLKSGKIAVYIDREKVSSAVAHGINQSRVNSTGLL